MESECNGIEQRFEELKLLRKTMLEKLATLCPREAGGISMSKKYPYCVWIDFPKTKSRIAFYEDARIDETDGNFHPGRYGYATFFKNLINNGGACESSNDVVNIRGKRMIIYNLDNRLATGIRVDEEHLDEIILTYKAFME